MHAGFCDQDLSHSVAVWILMLFFVASDSVAVIVGGGLLCRYFCCDFVSVSEVSFSIDYTAMRNDRCLK